MTKHPKAGKITNGKSWITDGIFLLMETKGKFKQTNPDAYKFT